MITWKNVEVYDPTKAVEARSKMTDKFTESLSSISNLMDPTARQDETIAREGKRALRDSMSGVSDLDSLGGMNAVRDQYGVVAQMAANPFLKRKDAQIVSDEYDRRRGRRQEDALGRARLAASAGVDSLDAERLFSESMAQSEASANYQAESEIGYREKGLKAFKGNLEDIKSGNDATITAALSEAFPGKVPSLKEAADLINGLGLDSGKAGSFTKDIGKTFAKNQMADNSAARTYEDTMSDLTTVQKREVAQSDKETALAVTNLQREADDIHAGLETKLATSYKSIDQNVAKLDNTNVRGELKDLVGKSDKSKVDPFYEELLALTETTMSGDTVAADPAIVNAVLKQVMLGLNKDTMWQGRDIDAAFKKEAKTTLSHYNTYRDLSTQLAESKLDYNTRISAIQQANLDSYRNKYLGGNQGTLDQKQKEKEKEKEKEGGAPLTPEEQKAIDAEAVKRFKNTLGSPLNQEVIGSPLNQKVISSPLNQELMAGHQDEQIQQATEVLRDNASSTYRPHTESNPNPLTDPNNFNNRVGDKLISGVKFAAMNNPVTKAAQRGMDQVQGISNTVSDQLGKFKEFSTNAGLPDRMKQQLKKRNRQIDGPTGDDGWTGSEGDVTVESQDTASKSAGFTINKQSPLADLIKRISGKDKKSTKEVQQEAFSLAGSYDSALALVNTMDDPIAKIKAMSFINNLYGNK